MWATTNFKERNHKTATAIIIIIIMSIQQVVRVYNEHY
jgi:hypothetical protein